jgi:hypothetical protein
VSVLIVKEVPEESAEVPPIYTVPQFMKLTYVPVVTALVLPAGQYALIATYTTPYEIGSGGANTPPPLVLHPYSIIV